MRPKKARPDARGLLLKERPFSFSARRDGTVATFYKHKPVTTLAGKIAEDFVAAAADAADDDPKFLMVTVT
ncbi:MAG: hypothetical protein ACR2MU_00970, partial [Gaiellaceae bacterium]